MEKTKKNSRLEFLQKLLAETAVADLYPYPDTVFGSVLYSKMEDKLPARPRGKKEYIVGIYSLGGQAYMETPEKEDISVGIINRAIVTMTKPYYKELQFFKNIPEWSLEW